MIEFSISGGTVLIDDNDLPLVVGKAWSVSACSRTDPVRYARHWPPGGGPAIRMHRLVMSAAPGDVVDHINGDGLDNRRANLRLCSTAQNLWNAKLRSTNTTGFRGVYAKKGRFKVVIRAEDRRQRYVGTYDTAEQAARAWDRAALALRGEFARLNFPEAQEREA